MKTYKFLFSFLVAALLFSCQTGPKHILKQKTDANGFTYEYVTNDPLGVRIYTLENGLKVFLSQNTDKPRIQTFVAVRAGSSYDPKETTGLAHYLEHMMFKGTSKIGTSNWEEEKQRLEKISDLYEKHKAESDPSKKKEIYAEIDRISQEAAQFAVPNEYDKLISSVGAQGTNAWTSNEETVYMNDIPTNELEKWVKLESERFGELVLRLFHTELETVYEEFNMSQDNDYRKSYFTLYEKLFPKHPYGQQTTIGKAEHLKNPSMVNIHNYWNTYYVPNNMAVCMSGDLDFERTIQLLNDSFGKLEPGDVPENVLPKEDPITEIIEVDVAGPDIEHLRFGYRFDGITSEDRKYVEVINHLLSNSVAGLIQLELVQQQKVIRAGSYSNFMKDYGVHAFFGIPRQGQSLEEVKDLIVGVLDKVKSGDFDDWLVEAAIKDMRLSQTLDLEDNWRAYNFVHTFIHGLNWEDELNYIDELEKITKEELVAFANEHYNDNYVAVYKRTGKDEMSVKVEKPQITSVPLNRDKSSEFFNEFKEMEVDRLKPVFVDFENDIVTEELDNGVKLNYVKGTVPNLFRLYFMVDMGSDNLKELPVAFDLLNYFGTDKYAPDELKKEFYKHGIRVNSQAQNDNAIFVLYGLEESYPAAIELLEHVLTSIKPDVEIYADFVDGMLKKRSDAKLDKSTILWDGLFSYGKNGPVNSFTNILTTEELKNAKPDVYTDLIKDLGSYPHRFVYCGQQDLDYVKSVIAEKHKLPEQLKEYPEAVKFEEREYDKPKIYFANYDMVQNMVLMISKDDMFNPELIPEARMFNEYFGRGLSSIVFQEIREAKGLAYSAFSAFSTPSKPDKSHYVYAYLSTQPDKLKDASDAMLDLMNNMPQAEIQFEGAKESVLKKLETERKVNTDLFWHYKWHEEMGIEKDNREAIYNSVKDASIDDLQNFFDNHIKGKNYAFLILGNKENLDVNTLKKIGDFEELSLEQLFNY